MTHTREISEFDKDLLTAACAELDDPTFAVEDLGHGNDNIVAELPAEHTFAATVLITEPGAPARWYASAAPVNGDDTDIEPRIGPLAEATSPREAAAWIRAAYKHLHADVTREDPEDTVGCGHCGMALDAVTGQDVATGSLRCDDLDPEHRHHQPEM